MYVTVMAALKKEIYSAWPKIDSFQSTSAITCSFCRRVQKSFMLAAYLYTSLTHANSEMSEQPKTYIKKHRGPNENDNY